jgi:hypothetical protein
MKTKKGKVNFSKEKTREEKQILPPPVEDFETFSKNLFAYH